MSYGSRTDGRLGNRSMSHQTLRRNAPHFYPDNVYEYDFGDVWEHEIRTERFPRRELNRRFKQYATGDDEWQWSLGDMLIYA